MDTKQFFDMQYGLGDILIIVGYISGLLRGTVTDPSGELTALNFGGGIRSGAIVTPTTSTGLYPYVSGIPEVLQSCIETKNKIIIDSILNTTTTGLSALDITDTTITALAYTVDLSSVREARVVSDVASNNITITLPDTDVSLLGKQITVSQINPTGSNATIINVDGIGNKILPVGGSILSANVTIPSGIKSKYLFTIIYDDNSKTYIWQAIEPTSTFSETDGLKFYDPVSTAKKRLISETDFNTLTYTDIDVGEATVLSALSSRKSPDFVLVLGDTVTVNKSLVLPRASEVGDGVNLTIFADYENPFFHYDIQSDPSDVITMSNVLNKFTSKYIISNKEKITLKVSNNTWYIESAIQKSQDVYDDDFVYNAQSPGDIIGYKSGRYKITSSLPSGFSEPDGSFVVALPNKTPYGQNTLYHSENLVSSTSNVRNWRFTIDDAIFGLSPWYNVNAEIGPSGEKTAEVFYAPLGFSTINFNQSNQLTDLNEGDTVTISFWAKSYNPDVYIDRISIGKAASPFTGVVLIDDDNYLDTIRYEWVRYEYTEVVSGVTGNIGTYSVNIRFRRNLTNTDTLLFSLTGVQLEKTKRASYYKPTDGTSLVLSASDTVYAQLLPDDNILDISDVYRGTNSDALFLKRAIEYFNNGGEFNEILVPDLTIDTALYSDTIAIGLPEFLTLRGAKHTSPNVSGNATLTVNLNDTTITFIDYLNNQGNLYSDKQNLINLNITAASPIKRLVNRNSAETSYITNCTISGNNFAIEGVRTGKEGRGSLFSYIINSSVTRCEYNILYWACGNEHVIEKCKFGAATKASLWVDGVPNLTIRDSDSEDNSELIFDISNVSRFIEFDNCYFEHGSTLPFQFDNVNNFILRNSRWSGFNTFAFPEEVRNLTFVSNVFSSAPVFSSKSSVYAINNSFTSGTSAYNWQNMMANSLNKFAVNTNVDASSIIEDDIRNFFGSGIGTYSRFDNTYLDGILGDTLIVNNVHLKGKQENLRLHSDSLGYVKSGLESVFSITDTIIDGISYDMFVSQFDTTFYSGNPIRVPSCSRTFNTDEKITFSFEYRYLNADVDASPSVTSFTFRYSNLPDFQSEQIVLYPSNDWRRAEVTTTMLSDGLGLSLESAAFAAGDSIIFRNFQVNSGRTRLAYIPTASSGIENTELTLDIDTTLVIKQGENEIFSVVADSNTVRLHQYGIGNKEVTDLGKTVSNYAAIFATDGTLIEQDMRLSRAEVYVDYLDPDTVTVVSAGNLYSPSDVTENVAVNFTTSSSGRLTYTGTKTIDVQIMWAATVTSNGANENIIGTVLDNNTSLTRIRWEEEDTTASDRHSVSAHGTFTMSTNDWIEPKFTSESNGTIIEIISMCFSAEEKQ